MKNWFLKHQPTISVCLAMYMAGVTVKAVYNHEWAYAAISLACVVINLKLARWF